ncbi:hypothetical protein DN752_00080 [Echinicola strongylocentroti]|uniref:Urea transporter n=1 Tax=Echinicola strongylocentroti TaxID=1795355 RepID=A0A2Z4ID20_9BACT|nr:urea transporter [Echinicola strongylocentroti]AWW28665.1 hypothetical protein DN752_00080 [Echinicola strongylocentroti]
MKSQKIIFFIKSFLKGIGQIMLQDSMITGLFFLVGVLFSSLEMGLGLILGTLVGTLLGYTFKGYHKELGMGLYGFNGALVGTAAIFGLGMNYVSILVLIAGSILATYLMHFAIKKSWSVFTFPFILASWLLISLLGSPIKDALIQKDSVLEKMEASQVNTQEINGIYSDESHEYHDKDDDDSDDEDDDEDDEEDFLEQWEDRLEDVEDLREDEFFNSLQSYGQVIFQGSLLTGLFCLLGVYYNKPIAAIYGVFGSILAILVAHILQVENKAIYEGLMGFNAVLCAITFAGTGRRDGFAVVVSCSLSVIIYITMQGMGIPQYTFPFVLGTWLMLLIQKIPFPKI